MAITPEEIADRKFLVGLRGYDRDVVRTFLTAVAEEFRSALEKSKARTNGSSTATTTEAGEPDREEAPPSTTSPASAAPATSSPEDFARMGEEVATILRTAHEQ